MADLFDFANWGKDCKLSFILVAVFLLIFTCLVRSVHSHEVTLTWDPVTHPDLAGYKTYYGTSGGDYELSLDVGNSTSCTIADLEDEITYYFAVTAYSIYGEESDFSNEVFWTSNAGDDAIILKANFDVDDDGFNYLDDLFRGSNEPSYADGLQLASEGFAGGTLQVTLGGIDNTDILDMSGGWQKNFTLNHLTEVVLSFNYKLTQASDYENDEFSQVLVSVDGTLYGEAPDDYVVQIVGNGNGGDQETTDWQFFEVNLGYLSRGYHTLTIGGYNNKKTYHNEITEVLIDDVLLKGLSAVSNVAVRSGEPYEVVLGGLEEDAVVYIDRGYTITELPAYLDGATYIKTANNDKMSTPDDFLSFDVNQDVTIYISHDNRIPQPSWLSNEFTDTGDDLVTTDTDFSIFFKDYPAGNIILGGNEGPSRNCSMYSVIVVIR
jgi:hypothetical protein